MTVARLAGGSNEEGLTRQLHLRVMTQALSRRQARQSTRAAGLLPLLFLSLSGSAGSQEPVTSTREVLTLDAQVDRIDRFARSLTLRTDNGTIQVVYAEPGLKIFDELKSGDRVRVRTTESVIVAVRPNAKPTGIVDTTAAAKKSGGDQRGEVLQELKAVVTVESIDPRNNLVMYKGGDNRSVTRVVADPALLNGLKRGDIVELTYARMRAIEITRR
jgi:hypothetical protein